ncbi:Tlg2-vesicle protein [Talaromyces marneffei ATCC 18224]|uniref:Golgi apparatus membrane protein TVP38 n=1 Tax=Talaromyces marneffei (strain ATCC 18224 / CBS 334.59 / QM 7333) TaxID=441960 RepID=B6QFA2_TALMQ|nr:uncharacterized protein EYB26_004192 [Talaromyces marneffei]EEA24137.1 conserved hypothetical protein [Talaromyces marneffei ATCC 18224]KAE8553348.1 hypothetical protein EYB25_004730 [Talaromyces marneffei]QGA16525.1 hypothetical protein EYB26_004192 [Talaromyces marneffei]
MPADYQSTARALSLPVSEPEEQESPLSPGLRPPWSHSPNSSRRGSRRQSTMGEAVSFRDRMINQAESFYRAAKDRWERMTLVQKTLYFLGSLLVGALGIASLILAGHIFIWLGPVAEQWEHSAGAYALVWFSIILVSFPPLVGWSTLGTISGFLFGFWRGWIVYASATVVGSTISFIVSRTVLSGFVKRMMEHDKRFAALALTLKYDGLKLLCMIRLCPLPYSICNGAVSTFPTVKPLSYSLATLIVAPKFMVPAFIGSRIRILSENNEQMSAGSKAINIISIIVSVSIGVATGIYIYRRTLARAKELEAEERAGIRRSIQEDHAAGRPHGDFSDDPDVNAAVKTLARDEEAQLGFYDEDNIDIDVEGGELAETHGNRSYRDEFTDNDSDVFDDGDGDESDTYGLHTHVRQ